MPEDRVIVAGAGIGGLAAAIELAAAGADVLVLERAARPGGKMRETGLGCAIDSGPTVLTMKWVFEALFERAGSALDARVSLQPAERLARHAWETGDQLDLHADAARSEDEIARFSGPADARAYRGFRSEAAAIFETLRPLFLTRQQGGLGGLLAGAGLAGAPRLAQLRPFETLAGALSRRFRDPRLRQLFGRYATYCGSSPFLAPATLMLVAHAEASGVWLVDGGMQRLAEALEALARDLGVTFRFNAEVSSLILQAGEIAGVALSGGERLDARCVVLNADPSALATGLFGEEARASSGLEPGRERSLSAVTWTFEGEPAGFELERHNVFFPKESRSEFEDIFARGRLPACPTVYLCAQDRPGPAAGPERFLALVNAPANGDRAPITEGDLAECEDRAFRRLEACGLRNLRPKRSVRTTPAGFNGLFPGTGGALYGTATHGWSAAFSRPGATTRIPGLFLAGGGVHPGPGVPMAALSGRLAADSAIRRLGSMRRSRPAATPGGISTPSATTAARA